MSEYLGKGETLSLGKACTLLSLVYSGDVVSKLPEIQCKILCYLVVIELSPIEIHKLPPDQGGGLHAFLPDFGHSACSACGDTIDETLSLLQEVKTNVIDLYRERGISIPEPSQNPVDRGAKHAQG